MIAMSEKVTQERSWRSLALPLSLLLNLFLIALIAGHLLLHHVGEPRIGELPLARGLANAEARLSRRDAAAIDSVFRRDEPRYVDAARDLVKARRALERQVIAQPFDRQATQRALAAWQASWNRFVSDFGGTLIDGLAQVSPEGRRKLVADRRRARFDQQAPEPP